LAQPRILVLICISEGMKNSPARPQAEAPVQTERVLSIDIDRAAV